MVLATEYTIKQTPLYELGPDLVLWVIGIFTCVGTNQPTYMRVIKRFQDKTSFKVILNQANDLKL